MWCDQSTAAVIMLRHYQSEIGLTTTRRGEMTSPTVIRRRSGTLQQRHTLPFPWSRREPQMTATCLSTSLPRQRSRTPCSERQTTGMEERWIVTHRPSSTLPLPRRAQLGITTDQPCSTAEHHAVSHRHQSHQHQCDRLSQHHHYHQQQLQSQALMTVDTVQRDHQNSAFSRASTMQSGNGTTNSASTVCSQGYFTDCESDQSKHRHQRQPLRRRRLPQPPTTTTKLPRRPARPSTGLSTDHREFRGAASLQFKHGDTGLHESVVARRFGGRSRREKFQPRSRSCDRTCTVNDNDTFTRCHAGGTAPRARKTDGQYPTWSGSSSRWSTTNSTVDDCCEPRRLAWKLHTPHGILSLRSTNWSETSGGTAVIGRSASADGWRQQTDIKWLTIPRLSRQSTCDDRRTHSLPASYRLQRQSCGVTATDERICLEPIGRGVETLECERCYLTATAHLRRLSAAGSPKTLPPLDIDTIASKIEPTGHLESDDLVGTSRHKRVDRLHSEKRRQHQVCQNYVNDSTETVTLKKPSNSRMTIGSMHNTRLTSCCHCHGTVHNYVSIWHVNCPLTCKINVLISLMYIPNKIRYVTLKCAILLYTLIRSLT